jgi:PAS domain S-box-containing protein
MENLKKEFCCYSTSLIIDYVQKRKLNDKILFSGIENYIDLLKNRHEWASMELLMKFLKNFEATGADLFNAGVEITESQVSNFQLLFLKAFPLSLIVAKIPDYFKKNIGNTLSVKVEYKKPGLSDVVFTPQVGYPYSPQLCDFNRGCTFATFKLKRLRNMKFSEITCAARSDVADCRYRISWTPDPPILERIKDFFFFRFQNQKAILAHMEENHKNLQKQYEEILSIKDFYSHIMDNMGEGVLWLDEEGKITFSNNGFSIISEYGQDELKGKYFWDFLSKSRSATEYQGIFKNIRSMPFVSELKEFAITTKNGEKRIGLASLVWVSSELQKPGFLVSIRDISEQKKVERELFASENRYRSLYENSPALILGLDLDGNFIFANPAMEEASGYSEEELVNMHFGALVAPDADFDVMRLFRGRLDKGVRLQEVHIKTKSGEWKAITLNTYPVKDNLNMVAGVAGIGVDVTETKRLNEQLVHSQRMDMLGKMAGGFAHDFKILLSVIMGYGGFIQNKTSDKSLQRFANNILKASQRATDLTQNLLTFSRGEVVKRNKFNLNRLLHEVKNFVLPVIPSQMTINTEIPKDQYYIKGDYGKIHQSVLNLCLNAKDAIGDKPGTITIRLANHQKEGAVFIEIEDTGPGIPPDIIEHIFDPFFSTKKKRQGTGLGLSVVYGIVKSHKGEITVESRPGEGATFRIELPTVPADAEDDTEKKPESKSGLIMVVDDDDLMREFCNESLRGIGYETIQFSDSNDALSWFKGNFQNVLFSLVDIQMPHMDGIEMVKQLRIIKNDFKVIYMSGFVQPETEIPTGEDPFLEKPFTSDVLADTIDSILYTPAGS